MAITENMKEDEAIGEMLAMSKLHRQLSQQLANLQSQAAQIARQIAESEGAYNVLEKLYPNAPKKIKELPQTQQVIQPLPPEIVKKASEAPKTA